MSNNILLKLKKELPDIQQGVLMKNHTTFSIGGPAEYFLSAKKEEDVIKAIALAKELDIPILVMGGGSNLLVSDNGISGIVVKNEDRAAVVLKEDGIVSAPAGMVLGTLVDFSIEHALQGLEWAGGLPGTFGGAVRGNAGAFGGEMKDSILEVRALDENMDLKIFSNQECHFSYRSSVFKEKSLIILSSSVKLHPGDKIELRKIADSRIAYRKEKHPLEYPNAGSVFKNVPVKNLSPELQKEFADKIKQDPFPIIPAAWFIIGAGLTGTTIGKAQISHKHSNYIVNTGEAKAQDVADLISFVKEKVKEKYHIDLEPEVQLVGF